MPFTVYQKLMHKKNSIFVDTDDIEDIFKNQLMFQK